MDVMPVSEQSLCPCSNKSTKSNNKSAKSQNKSTRVTQLTVNICSFYASGSCARRCKSSEVKLGATRTRTMSLKL